ncbi:MAG: thiazole synthase, partial [Burkholderiales bacterium]|nr:thiazole synthase [Burkholderiales bacterium]
MLNIDNQSFNSRFLLGTAGYPSVDILSQSIAQSETEIITVSLTRAKFNTTENQFFNFLNNSKCKLLPNTAGCFSAQDAIDTALLAQEVFGTNWIKLEVIGDDYTLNPNSIELLKATETLIALGFVVFPYCIDDIVICNELVNLGCKILMPMGSPIGSGQGLLNLYNLTTLRNKFPDIILIVDSGIGRPSDATQIMELGYDA